MKLSAVLFAFIGTQTRSDALPLSDELKAVSNFDYWAQSVTQSPVFGKEERTFDAAGRLRGIRADLFQLLNAMPEESFNQKSEQEENEEGSGSGDFYNQPDYNNYEDKDDNTIELVFDSQTGTFDDDVALLLRNGAIDESMLKTGGNVNQATLELGDKRGHGLFEKESNDVPTASVNDMPSFEKYMSGRNNREPRLISGQNKSNNSWLGYSLLGSIGAIFITVSATVCVRRVKSKKDETSGTPIQKLKRYQGHMNQANQQNRPGRTLNHVNFGPTGYNPAFRPQYFNPNQSVNGGFSSAMSTLSSGGSGFGMPNQVPQSAPAFANSQPASMNSHISRAMSLSSGYGSHGENRSQAPLTNPQDRALPPPPYAKVQY